MPSDHGHIHPLGHFCGSNCPKHTPSRSIAASERESAYIFESKEEC